MSRLPLPALFLFLLLSSPLLVPPSGLGAAGGAGGAAAAGGAGAASPLAYSTNDLVILNTNGVDFSAVATVFRGDVHVHDPRMYLECDLLTIRFQTNRIPGVGSPAVTNASGRVERIIAETNVLLMASGTTITGDRAVYDVSSQVAVVTGELVVFETQNSYMLCTNLIFNRATTNGQVVGTSTVVLKIDALSQGTNAASSFLGGGGGGVGRRNKTEPRPPKPAEPK